MRAITDLMLPFYFSSCLVSHVRFITLYVRVSMHDDVAFDCIADA